MADTVTNGFFHYLRMAQFRASVARGESVPSHAIKDWQEYNAVQVARRASDVDGRQEHTCRYCKLPIVGVGIYYMGTRHYVLSDRSWRGGECKARKGRAVDGHQPTDPRYML